MGRHASGSARGRPPAGGPARYVLGLGSNRRHGRHGAPAGVVDAAIAALAAAGLAVERRSPIWATAPVGPGGRRYANAAVLVGTPLDPPALLALAKGIERAFGRGGGRRWGQRVLDIDLLLWSGGRWAGRTLAIPHPRLGERVFALDPVRAVAPCWRIAGQRRAVHLHARLTRPRPLHR